ncbi:hypothetical protein DPMN_174301 [Dreissena polymorpha]|uniref:Uncharacterized protein n=1 Tax=Dreissena polymorpha TaxID=45954 RepID=A0A9D4IH00_DREPO|nr:hypothetical protein DPMN_174301 [Dreissena polymorpha]
MDRKEMGRGDGSGLNARENMCSNTDKCPWFDGITYAKRLLETVWVFGRLLLNAWS